MASGESVVSRTDLKRSGRRSGYAIGTRQEQLLLRYLIDRRLRYKQEQTSADGQAAAQLEKGSQITASLEVSLASARAMRGEVGPQEVSGTPMPPPAFGAFFLWWIRNSHALRPYSSVRQAPNRNLRLGLGPACFSTSDRSTAYRFIKNLTTAPMIKKGVT
jgi:hypothetical protein